MKILVLFILMMVPVVSLAQETSSCYESDLNKEALPDKYQQLPAVGRQLALVLLEHTQFDDQGGFWVYSGDTIRDAETMALRVIEDNSVTEICNIPFGSSYETSKKILTEKYGDSDFLASTKDCIVYRDKFYSGIHFTDLFFMFQSDGKNSHFNKAILSRNTKTKEEAIQLKKSFDEKLRKQYQIYKVLDEGNIYISMGGICPIPSEGVFGGYAIGVDVLKFDTPTTRNGCMYSTRITYGPYEYIKESF